MTVQRQIDRLITHRASEWVQIMKHPGPAEQAAFVDWLRESRRHIEEYLTLVALEHELDDLGDPGDMTLTQAFDRDAVLRRLNPGITALPGALPIASANRATSAPPASRTATRRRRWRATTLAAGLAAAAMMLALFMNRPPATLAYVTAAGEQRAIELADGSAVHLNAQSHLKVQFDGDSRALELVAGEALFDVARDPHRPFTVRSANTLVEALGTQFNIDMRSTATEVSVVEGRIRISVDTPASLASGPHGQHRATVPTNELRAGETAFIGTGGTIQRQAHTDIARAIAWREKRTVFQRTPLEEVVREFNRHNAAPKLRLEGIAPGTRHYSASVNLDDPRSFADLLSREADLAVDLAGEEIMIRLKTLAD